MSRADNSLIWARLEQYRAMHDAWSVGLEREDIHLIKAINQRLNDAYIRGRENGRNLNKAKSSEPILTTPAHAPITVVSTDLSAGGYSPNATYTAPTLKAANPVKSEAISSQDYYLARAAIRNAVLRFQEYKTIDPAVFFEELKDTQDLFAATTNFHYLIGILIRKAQLPLKEEIQSLKTELHNLKAESRVIHNKMITDAVQAVHERLSTKYGTGRGFHTGGYIPEGSILLKDNEFPVVLERARDIPAHVAEKIKATLL